MSKKSVSNNRNQRADDFDLAASGSSGSWTVFIDESHTGPERWFAQIKGPSIYFSFGIRSPKSVDQLLKFLAADTSLPSGNSAPAPQKLEDSHTVGNHNRFPIRLIRDTEYVDRFFLVCGTAGSSLVRYAVYGDDLRELVDALRQAHKELSSQGLLGGDNLRKSAGTTSTRSSISGSPK